MVFDLAKCAMMVVRKGNVVRKEETELPDGKRMRGVKLDGYNYLGVL